MSETIRITVANYAALPAASTMLNGRAKTLDDDAVYVSRRVNGSVVWLDSDDPLAQEFGSGGSGGAGASIIRVATVELTDEQIKALPTTPVEIVAAPGEGKIAVLLKAVAILNWTADYTNISGGSYMNLFGATSNGMNLLVQDLNSSMSFFFAGGRSKMTIASTWHSEQALEGWSFALAPFPQNDEPGNSAVLLLVDNSGGNFTGGNAANTLKMTVLYYVLDVS